MCGQLESISKDFVSFLYRVTLTIEFHVVQTTRLDTRILLSHFRVLFAILLMQRWLFGGCGALLASPAARATPHPRAIFLWTLADGHDIWHVRRVKRSSWGTLRLIPPSLREMTCTEVALFSDRVVVFTSQHHKHSCDKAMLKVFLVLCIRISRIALGLFPSAAPQII